MRDAARWCRRELQFLVSILLFQRRLALSPSPFRLRLSWPHLAGTVEGRRGHLALEARPVVDGIQGHDLGAAALDDHCLPPALTAVGAAASRGRPRVGALLV